VSDQHFRYDPEVIETDEKIPLPIGTVAEVEAEGMDVSKVPTCHIPVEGGAKPIVGCFFAQVNPDTGLAPCKLHIKGVSGPQNFAVKTQKGRVQGGKRVIAEHPCFFIARHKDAIEENGGSITIVATEGNPYRKIIVGPDTDPKYNYKEKIVEAVVTPFVRPKDNPEIAYEVLKALERSDMAKEKSERAADRTS
jgi:hypothetical protein